MKKKLIQITFSIFLLVSLISTAQTVYPYLQSCTSTSIYITWKTSSDNQSLVTYGTSSTALSNMVNGTTQVMNDVGYPNNYYYHSVSIKGLAPNTVYFYKVSSGTFTSDVYSFKTLPLPGKAATANGHIRFLIMGDNEIDNEFRFDSLMIQAKRKCEEKYSGVVNENVSGILMLGDQVNEGTLGSYEKVHFAKSRYLSPYLPIQTAVGENEMSGTLKLAAYTNLFYYDSLSYKGIFSGTENYYAYQVGNALIINLSTEHVSNTQFSWLENIMTTANNDTTVQWIISLGHRPYQAEQYVGDISPWIRSTVVPYLASSPKFLMHVGAHHHLYARGQLKDKPVYNVISGGTAWNQFWTVSQEQDMDDVQKTLTNWAYNIVDIDVVNAKVDIETYAVGKPSKFMNNVLIDQFHRYKNRSVPGTPSFTNIFGDSLQLPYTITGSAFTSASGELVNSTEFQISNSASFTTLEKDSYRDYENFFGMDGGKADSTKNLNAGLNILNLTLKKWEVPNGKHYVRLRYRDRNLEWSAWSETDSFRVYNSVAGITALTTNKKSAELTDSIVATYTNGPAQPKDWVGVFKAGTTPATGTIIQKIYTTGSNGSVVIKNIPAGQYFICFFTADSLIELTPRIPIYFGNIPVVTTNAPKYKVGDTVKVNYSHAPGLKNDWIGIYESGTTLSGIDTTRYKYVSGASGTVSFTNLPKGFYFANYFVEDGFTEPGNRAYFSIGATTNDTIANLILDKSVYKLTEPISATWTNAPGFAKDELIIYTAGSNPGIDTPVGRIYTDGAAIGTKTISSTAILPKQAGNYFIALYTNDAFTEISNRVNFKIIDTVITSIIKQSDVATHSIKIYPNPVSSNGTVIIESITKINHVELIDIAGRVLYTKDQINDKSFAITDLNLPVGIYYVRIYQEDKNIQVSKLVLQE